MDPVVQQSLDVVSEFFVPLTLRQIFYRLVSALHIPNTVAAYKRLSRILVKARLEGDFPWDKMEDRTREFAERYGEEE